MLKEKYTILIGCCLWLMMSSCTDELVLEEEPTLQQYDLVFSVGRQGTMRMADAVVQTENQPFRGLQGVWAIPFRTNGAITVTDNPLLSTSLGAVTEKVDDSHYYYILHCSLSQGTNRILAYGQAKQASGYTTEAQNGKLETTLAGRMSLADITFNLTSIRPETEAHSDAQALADYLTAIANTEGWSMTTDPWLKALYLAFIHADAEGSGMMAGSAAHVAAYVAALQEQLEDKTDDISTAIKASINGDLKSCLTNGYPSGAGSLGLPDGAAALRWTGDAFSVRTMTTTLDNINGIDRYTYPAELWYIVDSPIRTSNEEVAESAYENITWNALIANNYQAGHIVSSSTKSIAVENPLQYGVGRLQMVLSTITGSLKDSKNETVDYTNASNLPLTAVIIGGQHTVGFDFRPMGEPSDVDARFIYDPVEGNPATVNTLVLQSYDEEKVPIILEFENKTGHQFHGKDGIIYPDTKFYLIAQVDPTGLGEGAYANRVFTQDYITKMTMRVTSLAKAYSCMPDLLQPRLEVGVEVQTQWILSTPTTVKL